MKNNLVTTLSVLVLLLLSQNASSQSLLETLDKEYPTITEYELATFKGTHLAIGQSIENRRKGTLQFMNMNRFWNLPDNTNSQSFIADRWNARLGLEYSITDRFTVGGGWNSFEKISDSYLKYNLIRQIKHSKKSLSVTLFQHASYIQKNSSLNSTGNLDDVNTRLAYTSQILIARKFTPEISIQVTPTFVRKVTPSSINPNNIFALGFGGRYRIKPHVSIVSEYYYVANPLESVETFGAFALGVNWDVRFLLLQFQMTNAVSMVEDRFITQTRRNFNSNDGNFFFGFNAIFTIHTKK